MPDRIRCDDPKLSHYPFRSEDTAFRAIVSTKGKGLRKAKREADARKGPCPGRGGFHTNVLRGGDSVASIVGCNCCDDSNGNAVEKQKATVIDKR